MLACRKGLMTFPLRFESSQATAKILAQYLTMNKMWIEYFIQLCLIIPMQLLLKRVLAINGCNLVSFELKNKTEKPQINLLSS